MHETASYDIQRFRPHAVHRRPGPAHYQLKLYFCRLLYHLFLHVPGAGPRILKPFHLRGPSAGGAAAGGVPAFQNRKPGAGVVGIPAGRAVLHDADRDIPPPCVPEGNQGSDRQTAGGRIGRFIKIKPGRAQRKGASRKLI